MARNACFYIELVSVTYGQISRSWQKEQELISGHCYMIVKALSNGMNFIPSYFVFIVYVHLFFLIDFNMKYW